MIVKITSEESLSVEKAFVEKEINKKLLNFLNIYYPSYAEQYVKKLEKSEQKLHEVMSPIGKKYILPGYNTYTFDFENEVIYYE